MYLFIFEDGEMLKSASFSDEEKQSCDDGYLDVIDLHAENPCRYIDGEWVEIELAFTQHSQ